MLGSSVEALENNSAQYITAMKKLLNIYMSRVLKFWEWSTFIHDLTSGREEKRVVKLINDVTKSVIEERKKQYLNGHKNVRGKRKALMDLLLELHFETKELSEEDICEEVNTFVAA
ncbi:cytochrome P450 4V2, partial [Nephila pilipes]